MKKFYNFWLIVILLFGINFSMSAQDDGTVTTTVYWDTPGSVLVYNTSVSAANLVELAPGQTEYTASNPEGWGYLYVVAVSPYTLIDAVPDDGGTTLNPITYLNPARISFNLSTCDGKRYHVNVATPVKDGNISVNFVSGGEVTATFGGTGREVTLQPGLQDIPFSTAYETTLEFFGNKNYADDYYILQNSTDMNWRLDAYGIKLVHDDITLHDGDQFEVKFNNESPSSSTETKYTVTLNCTGANTASVVTMIYNTTQNSSIAERDSFEVTEGDVLRFAFNTGDYNVTVNGNAISSTGESTNWETSKINSNITYNIVATEREYGTTTVKIAVNTIEGLEVRVGNLYGDLVNLASLLSTPVTLYGTEYQLYEVPVSVRYPIAYVDAADGYTITESKIGYTTSNCVTSSAAQPLRVRIVRSSSDERVAIFAKMGYSTSLSDFTVTTNQGVDLTLEAGQNVFVLEPADSPLTVTHNTSTSPFSVYKDYEQVEANDDPSNTYTTTIADGTVIYIFDKMLGGSIQTHTITRNEMYVNSLVTYDAVKTASIGEFRTFEGAPIIVTPELGGSASVDGDEVTLTAGSYSFNAGYGNKIEFYKTYANPDMESGLSKENIADTAVNVIINFGNAGARFVRLKDQSKLHLEETTYAAYPYSATPTRVFDVNVENSSQSRRRAASSGTVSEGDLIGTLVGVEFPAVRRTDGTYLDNATLQFTSDPGAFTVDDITDSPEYTTSYSGIITAVGTVEIDETNHITVFTLDGHLLLDRASLSSFATLPSGAYILNGKKVLK